MNHKKLDVMDNILESLGSMSDVAAPVKELDCRFIKTVVK